jgi:hypothetical protein
VVDISTCVVIRHACRIVLICHVCAQTIEYCRASPSYSTTAADIDLTELGCIDVERYLRDSFNAFCFTCRRITMSVPGGSGVSANDQLCYLRSQVRCFHQLVKYDLVDDENMHELARGGGHDDGDW